MVYILGIKLVELMGKRGGLMGNLMSHNEGWDAACQKPDKHKFMTTENLQPA
jgi:hypothetical protein